MSNFCYYEARYPRSTSKFRMIREKGGFRTPLATKDAQIGSVLAFDVPEEGEVDILRPKLNRSEKFTAGGGRDLSYIAEHGYPPRDETIPFYKQTSIHEFAVMGNCITTGTSTSVSGSTVTRTSPTVLTLDATLTVDAHIGQYINIDMTGGVYQKYVIKDNDATTVTVDVTTDPAVASKAWEIFGSPYTKIITQGNCFPSYCAAIRVPNSKDSGEDINLDILGVVAKSNELVIEKGGESLNIQNTNFLVAKGIDGSGSLEIPVELPQKLTSWVDVKEFDCSYNSENPITSENLERIGLMIENDSSLEAVMGDRNADYVKIGSIDYSLTLRYKPKDKVFYDLINTLIANYVTDLDVSFKVWLDNTGTYYIEYELDKWYLAEHPESIASKEDDQMIVEARLKKLPEGTLIVTEVSTLGLEYFEGSYHYVAP